MKGNTEKIYNRFSEMTIDELLEVINNKKDYTPEALEILDQVIEEEGGMEQILKHREFIEQKKADRKRLTNEIKDELNFLSKEELKDAHVKLQSTYYNEQELEEILEEEKKQFIDQKNSTGLTPSGLIRLVIAAIISIPVTASLMTLILMKGKTYIPYLMLAIVVGMNYVIIRLITKRTKLDLITISANIITLAASMLLLGIFKNVLQEILNY